MKGASFLNRLGCACAGWLVAWHQERSFRTQLWCGVAAIIVTAFLAPSPVWWALVALAIGLVLATELLNTAIEKLIDHLHPAQHSAIKAVKDMAAGAVLIASLTAVAVGLFLVIAVVWPR